jgi:signal transduction histidine kinase
MPALSPGWIRSRCLRQPRSLRAVSFGVPPCRRWGMLFALCLAAGLASAATAPGNSPDPRRPAATTAGPEVDPATGLGLWIWTTNTYPRQTCRLWKAFDIPRSMAVARARLRITADNGYILYLDGRELGRGANWHLVSEYDLTWLLEPGRHVLGVDAFNDADTTGVNVAGVILGLRIESTDGQVLALGTDGTWRVVPNTERNWEARTHARASWLPARVIGPWWGTPEWHEPLRIRRAPPEHALPVHFWQQAWFQITLLSVCGVVVLICLRLMAQMTLQAKAQALLQLERARIARDIHDDLGAGLTRLVLMGEVAQSEWRGDSPTRQQIGQLCERARELSHTMDEVVWAINSRRDTLRDFATYVCKYAQAYLAPTPIRCRLDVEPELPDTGFDLPLRRNLFLAVKEALTNAAKHSGATELYLRIHRRGEGLIVIVEDNGRGIALERASPERNGLTNMAQRLNEAGGTCHLSSEPGAGCRVEFSLPALQAQPRPRWLRWGIWRAAPQAQAAERGARLGVQATHREPANR